MLMGVDYHPSFQQIAFFEEETGECGERQLLHSDGEADRYRTWCELEHRPLGWASRSLQREVELLIMVEVWIEEMFGSD
jgi:hypothetical protein